MLCEICPVPFFNLKNQNGVSSQEPEGLIQDISRMAQPPFLGKRDLGITLQPYPVTVAPNRQNHALQKLAFSNVDSSLLWFFHRKRTKNIWHIDYLEQNMSAFPLNNKETWVLDFKADFLSSVAIITYQ